MFHAILQWKQPKPDEDFIRRIQVTSLITSNWLIGMSYRYIRSSIEDFFYDREDIWETRSIKRNLYR